MHSHPHGVSCLTLALAVATAFVSICHAQEVATLDLTKVAVRDDLRRPKATPPGGYTGTEQTSSCRDSTQEVGTLRTSLVSLDRTHYQLGDEPRFELTVENAGSTPVRIPFSPHLADLQPENPAQKFAYFKLQITLWIASRKWRINDGGRVVLYGADDHANTMLTLDPGEWVRVIGKGHLSLTEDPVKLAMSSQPANYLYAKSALYRSETLITPTLSATASREVCLAQTQGQSVPIQLTIP